MAYSWRMEGEILRIEFSGTLTNYDLAKAGHEVAELESTCPVVPHRIADLRPVQRLEIDFPGVLALAADRLRRTFPNSFKSAILAREIVHYGFARMFQTLNGHPQIVIAIFGDDTDALRWLRLADLSPPSLPWQPIRS